MQGLIGIERNRLTVRFGYRLKRTPHYESIFLFYIMAYSLAFRDYFLSVLQKSRILGIKSLDFNSSIACFLSLKILALNTMKARGRA